MRALIRAAAFVLWADGKIEDSEQEAALALFAKYGLEIEAARAALDKELDALITVDDPETEKGEIESEGPIEIGVLDFGEVDFYEVLIDLAGLAFADGELALREIEIIHLIARSCVLDPIMATMALFEAYKRHPGAVINLD